MVIRYSITLLLAATAVLALLFAIGLRFVPPEYDTDYFDGVVHFYNDSSSEVTDLELYMYNFRAKEEGFSSSTASWAIWGPVSLEAGGSKKFYRRTGAFMVDILYTVNNRRYRYTEIDTRSSTVLHFKTDSKGNWTAHSE